MLDAGMILVVTATDLTQDDLQIITAAVDVENVFVVWLGGDSTDIPYNLFIPEKTGEWDDRAILEVVQEVKVLLQNQGVIFRP